MEFLLRLCVYRESFLRGGLSVLMFLLRATMGGWLLIASAILPWHPTLVFGQEDQSPDPTPAPESIREEPLPVETLIPPSPPPLPAPAPLSPLETLTQARQALHMEPDAQEP